jgi:hypothetical protein
MDIRGILKHGKDELACDILCGISRNLRISSNTYEEYLLYACLYGCVKSVKILSRTINHRFPWQFATPDMLIAAFYSRNDVIIDTIWAQSSMFERKRPHTLDEQKCFIAQNDRTTINIFIRKYQWKHMSDALISVPINAIQTIKKQVSDQLFAYGERAIRGEDTENDRLTFSQYGRNEAIIEYMVFKNSQLFARVIVRLFVRAIASEHIFAQSYAYTLVLAYLYCPNIEITEQIALATLENAIPEWTWFSTAQVINDPATMARMLSLMNRDRVRNNHSVFSLRHEYKHILDIARFNANMPVIRAILDDSKLRGYYDLLLNA